MDLLMSRKFYKRSQCCAKVHATAEINRSVLAKSVNDCRRGTKTVSVRRNRSQKLKDMADPLFKKVHAQPGTTRISVQRRCRKYFDDTDLAGSIFESKVLGYRSL